MKKNFFYAGMIAMSMLTVATSCSKDQTPIVEEGTENQIPTGEQIIVFDMQDTDVLASRSRPLYSTDNQGAEKVTDVKLFIFQHQKADDDGVPSNPPMKLINILTIENWNLISSDYNYGRKYAYKLEGNNKLQLKETYTILAVGQDESNITSENNASFAPYKIYAGGLTDASYISTATWATIEESLQNATWNASATAGKGFLLTEARGVEGYASNAEIFSGVSQPIDVVYNGGFTTNVLLKRQVAGVLGYFTKIPAVVANDNSQNEWYKNYDAVKRIRLVAHAKNTQIDLTRSLADQKDDATDVNYEYVVNGFNATTTSLIADAKFKATADASGNEDAYTVYEIDLSKWFSKNTSATDQTTDASYWFGTNVSDQTIYFENGVPTLGEVIKYSTTQYPNWSDVKTTISTTWVNILSQSNSYPAVAENSVLAGEFVIPFNKVVGDNNTFELQLIGGTTDQETILKKWNVKLDDASIDAEDNGDTEYFFNIYRNHLYQIGKRGAGDSPTDPGDGDKDDPQALDKDQDLVIKINDQWEFIHDMELE